VATSSFSVNLIAVRHHSRKHANGQADEAWSQSRPQARSGRVQEDEVRYEPKKTSRSKSAVKRAVWRTSTQGLITV
jgi:hypothetical protein